MIYGVPKESVPHSREAWGDEHERLYKAELEAWGKTLNSAKREWPTDEEGEEALEAVKKSMPSEAQTRYNQRDIKKRKEKIENKY